MRTRPKNPLKCFNSILKITNYIRSGDEDSGASTPPLEMKMDKKEEPEVNGLPEKEKEKEDDTPTVDIMAQQLKFVACLKILMEELSTLATGFEVDGKFQTCQILL